MLEHAAYVVARQLGIDVRIQPVGLGMWIFLDVFKMFVRRKPTKGMKQSAFSGDLTGWCMKRKEKTTPLGI